MMVRCYKIRAGRVSVNGPLFQTIIVYSFNQMKLYALIDDVSYALSVDRFCAFWTNIRKKCAHLDDARIHQRYD